MVKRIETSKIKYVVIFDTNTLIFGSPFRGNVVELIDKYERDKKVSLKYYVPRVVLEEIKSKMPQQIKDAKSRHSNATKQVNGLMGTSFQEIEEVYSDKDINEATDKAFERYKINILNTPKISFDDILTKAIYHLPPFAPEGDSGFKDAVIAETIKYHVPALSRDSKVVFICADERFRKHVIEISKDNKFQVCNSVEEFESELKLRILNLRSGAWFEKNLSSNAEQVFFVKNDSETVFYRENIENEIYKKFPSLFANPKPTLDFGLGYAGVSMRMERGKWIPLDKARFDVYKPIFIKKDNGHFIWESRMEYNQRFENIESGQIYPDLVGVGIGGVNPSGTYTLLFVARWSCNITPEGKIDNKSAKLIDIQQNRIWPYMKNYMENLGAPISMPTTLSGTATAERF